MKNKLLALCFVLCFGTSLFAQWTSNAMQNTMVHDSSGTEQATPLIASLEDGRTYISWFDMYNGQYQLKMQLLDAEGYKLWAGPGLVVSNHPQNSALFRYDLKTDKEGNAIVAFQDERTGPLEVVAYKISPTGSMLWGPNGILLTDSLATDGGMSPTIGITSSNDAIIAWNVSASSTKWISFQKILPNGTLGWNAIHRIKDNVKKYGRAVFVPAGQSDFIMMYVEEMGNFPGVTCTMYAQRFDTGGNPVWATPSKVSTKTISFFFFPRIEVDPNGGFFLAFTTSNPLSAAMNDVYAQHMDDNGTTWTQTGTESGDSLCQKITGGFDVDAATGKLYVAMQMLDGSQSQSGISVQSFDAAGNKLLGNNGITVLPISATYYLPSALTSTNDGFIISYTQGGFGAELLKALKVDANGAMVWPNPVTLCSVNSNKDKVQAGDFTPYQVVIVWDDDRIDGGIYAQNITSGGAMGITTGFANHDETINATIIPNPAQNPEILFNLKEKSNTTITITDVCGKVVFQDKILLPAGKQIYQLPELYISEGMYFLNLKSVTGSSTLKWIKNM